MVTTTNQKSTTPTNQQSPITTNTQDDDDDDDDGDDDDRSSSSTSSTNTPDDDDDDGDDDDGDDDDDDNDGDDDDNDDDDDDNDGDDDDNDNDGDDDDDDNDSDDDDNDSDDDDDDGGSSNLVSSVRQGSLLKEVKANPALAKGVAGHIKKAGGARPLGSTSTTTFEETNSATQSSYPYLTTTSYLLDGRVSEMSSTTQSSYLSGGRVSDPSYFLAELDASGSVEFTFKRKTGSTVSTLSTTDQDVSSRRVDDLASGWEGVETHKDTADGIFNWDAYADIQGSADSDYISLGSWLFIYKDPESGSFTGSYDLGVAAGGNDPFERDNLAGLTGAASYRGPSTGLYMTKADADADPVFDYFDARADLAVDFGDATVLGSISGKVSRGRTDGGVSLPELVLGSADITGSVLGGNFDGDTSGTTSDGVSLSGKWGGKFFGNRAGSTDHPGSVAGTFGGNTADGLKSVTRRLRGKTYAFPGSLRFVAEGSQREHDAGGGRRGAHPEGRESTASGAHAGLSGDEQHDAVVLHPRRSRLGPLVFPRRAIRERGLAVHFQAPERLHSLDFEHGGWRRDIEENRRLRVGLGGSRDPRGCVGRHFQLGRLHRYPGQRGRGLSLAGFVAVHLQVPKRRELHPWRAAGATLVYPWRCGRRQRSLREGQPRRTYGNGGTTGGRQPRRPRGLAGMNTEGGCAYADDPASVPC